MDHDGIERFARWIEALMRSRGYDIDSPRGGGRAKLAETAGVHRAAISRLLQRQSMPDLDTMRRLAPVLGVGVRDMLIRSGRLAEDELPLPAAEAAAPRAHGRARLSAEEAADALGIPSVHRTTFVVMVRTMVESGGEHPSAAVRSAEA